MKNSITKIISVLSIASIALFTSCSNDDDSNITPEIKIELTEVGHDNSKQVQAGTDLHLDAEIFAAAKIATVTVEMHNESDAAAPEITAVYDDYDGLLNATFHKHIDIPATQPAGHYHLHLVVIDKEGNKKTIESEVEVLAADVESSINVNITELGHGSEGNWHAHAGDDIHIEGTITSVHPITTVAIEIHSESNTTAPTIEAVYENYSGQTEADFHQHLIIPANQPKGEYHVHFIVKDNEGHEETKEYHLEIE